MTYSGRHLAYFLHLKPKSLDCMELLRWFWLSCKYMYIYFLEESIINLVPSPLRVLCACGWNDEFAKTCAMKFKWGDVSGPRHPWSISACHQCTILTLHSSLLLFTADAFQLGWGLLLAMEVLWTLVSRWGIVNNDIMTKYCETQTPLAHQPVTMIFLQSTRWRQAPMPFHRAFCSLVLQKLSKFAKRHIFRSLLSARLNCRCIRLCFKGNQ